MSRKEHLVLVSEKKGFKFRDNAADPPSHQRHIAALSKDVHPKPIHRPEIIGEVNGAVFQEKFLLGLRQYLKDHRLQFDFIDGIAGSFPQTALGADARLAIALQMQIGALRLNYRLEILINFRALARG